MSKRRTAHAVSLLVSCATVAMLAAPGLAADGDLPVDPPPTNQPPAAQDDSATVTSGGSVTVPVLANDSDPDGSSSTPLFIADLTPPVSGTAVVVGADIEYTAAADYVGDVTFTYRVSDGELTAEASVTVTVTQAPNTSPVAVQDRVRTRWGSPVLVDVAANDSDSDGDPLVLLAVDRPAHGSVDIVRGQARYTPEGKYVGIDSMTYAVGDGRGGETTGTLQVRVFPRFDVTIRGASTAVALRPMSVRGIVSTRIDGPVTVSLQRRSANGRWFDLLERRVRGEDSFALTWTPPLPGPMALRFRAEWAGGWRNTSAVQQVKVDAHFDAEVQSVSAKDVPHTWRPGCPVPPSRLRKIRMNYWDYQGRLQRGTLIGAAYVTQDYLAIFRRAFDAGFQIKQMRPADRFGGVDERAMRAGNTSAFNCRHVTGNPYRMSQHSYGNAIDINTFENPYVTPGQVYPPRAAVPYYYRREHNLRDPGVITPSSAIAQELWRQGWSWGARWSPPDYQHWSSNGG